jgi:hypothetical protein
MDWLGGEEADKVCIEITDRGDDSQLNQAMSWSLDVHAAS